MVKKRMAVVLIGGCLGGCAASPPITSGKGLQLNVSIAGLPEHRADPDDGLWLYVYEGEISDQEEPVGMRRFAGDWTGSILVDAAVQYTVVLSSLQSYFGGLTSCTAKVPIAANIQGSVTIVFTNVSGDCSAKLTIDAGNAAEVKVSEYQGAKRALEY